MIAYVFWHRPARGEDRRAYEQRLQAFHAALDANRPAGFHASAALRVEVPWLSGPGYEDWYLVEAWADIGTLNDAAVDMAHRGAHDRVAVSAAEGVGGIYALRAGKPALDASEAAWLDKPRDKPYDEFRAELLADGIAVWERQLVLGPGPEFCLFGAVAEPTGARTVERALVWPVEA
jgi:hypothetical protein